MSASDDKSRAWPRRRFLATGRDIALGLGVAGLQSACSDEKPAAPITAPDPSDPPPPAGQPNIILFLIDDLGVTDCGHCGSTYYRTPHLDRFAREGIRHTQAYSPSPLCSASRAAILTGKYPHRIGITGAIWCPPGCTPITTPRMPNWAPSWQKTVTPDFLTQFPAEEITLAEILRDAGYATAHIGKWHLGGSDYGPATQGFQFVVGGGNEAAPGNHFSPWGLAGFPAVPAGEYLADYLTARAAAFITEKRADPFFLSLSHYGVHLPLQAKGDALARYAATQDPDAAQRNAAYAAMVESVDDSLGALMNHLAALGLENNTLVIVTSDNGGLIRAFRDPLLRRITSNGPFRGGKAQLYEGGIRVPLLLRWPGKIAAGVTREAPVNGVDIFPTILEAAGLPPQTGIDGESLAREWLLPGVAATRPLFWHFPHYMPLRESAEIHVEEHAFNMLPASAVRAGHFKLLRIYGEGAGGTPAHELYDLAADDGEKHDVSRLHPAVVSELSALLDDHLAQTGALIPQPNRDYSATLDGWRANAHARATMGHGALRVEGIGNWPALLHGTQLKENVICRVRLRSSRDARITLYHSTQASGAFTASHSSSHTVPAGTALQDFEFRVPASAETPVRSLRLDTGTRGDVIEIDEIVLFAEGEPARAIRHSRFSGVSGLAYGGSWFAEHDTFVACGPGSLQVDLAGPAPVIISPPVTLQGPLHVAWRMRSSGSGEGAIAWAMTFSGVATSPKREPVALIHDGDWHEYSVLLPENSDMPVQRLAMAMGNGVGAAEIDWIRIEDGQRALLAVWEFCAGAG